MARFRRRKHVEAPEPDRHFPVPPRFNFTRDVVEAAALDAHKPALTFVDHEGIIDRRTFKEVADDASRWASYFRSQGLLPGDRVLVFVGKTPVWHSVMLGSLKAGLVAVPCSEMLRAGDIAFRVSHAGAKLVVTDGERAPVLEGVAAPVEIAVVEELKDELRTRETNAPTHDTAAEDAAFILYTSGTTKDPKGVVHSHGYTWTKRLQAAQWLTARPDDLVWCTAGTGWAKSIWNVLLGPWSCGAEIAIHGGGFDAEERFDLIERLGVTVLCQAPTEYRMMAKLPELERFYLGGVRHAVSAGEPLNPEVIEAFRVAFGLTIYDGYGQTENTLLVANMPDAELKPGSMGRPTPGHDVSVIDDSGREQPTGVEGDIALRGRPPSLFLRYWDAEEETAAAFLGEWYVTGDRGTRDDDGYLWFTARADDVILSSAYRIGPFEVESALLEHPAVLESAVVGKPDADRGSIVKAFVVLREGYDPSDELVVELQDHVKSVTAPYKYPREIEFTSELPKTSSGKIRRVVLRDVELRAASPLPPPPAREPEPPADATGAEEDARHAAAEAAAVAALAAEQARRDRDEADRRAEEERRRTAEARQAEEARQRVAERAQAEQPATRDVEDRRAARAAAKAEEQQRRADEKRRHEEAKAAAEKSRQDEAEAARAAKAQAKEDAKQRKLDEKRRREEERAAADQARRDEAEARRAAEARAREEAEERKLDEKRRREEASAAAEQMRRDEAEARRAAQVAAADAARREKDERGKPAATPPGPVPAVPDPDDVSGEDDEPTSAELIARLRAYGLGDSDESALRDQD